MKTVSVLVREVRRIEYRWFCPYCSQEQVENHSIENLEDWVLQTIYCKYCHKPIYRQSSGIYGTGRPA